MERVRHFEEGAVTLLDFLPGERGQPLDRELLDHERAHHAAIDHRGPEDRFRDAAMARQITHESTGKSIARAGWIDHFLERPRRHREKRILAELQNTILAAL